MCDSKEKFWRITLLLADNHETVLQMYQELGKSVALPDLMVRLDVPAEQASQCRLPAGIYAQHTFNRILTDLSCLGGNTHWWRDTEKLLLEGVAADNKLDARRIMLINHRSHLFSGHNFCNFPFINNCISSSGLCSHPSKNKVNLQPSICFPG